MTSRRMFKRRRVDDGDGTIAGVASSSLESMQRAVSPPFRIVPATPVSTSTTQNSESRDDVATKAQLADENETEDGGTVITKPDSEATTATRNGDVDTEDVAECDARDTEAEVTTSSMESRQDNAGKKHKYSDTRHVASPFQLTRIRDLVPSQNVDTVTLDDILGHPLLTECWQFNYLHSIPFILSHFDPDTRPHVRLRIVHGFWRNDDVRRQKLLEQAAAAGDNVQLLAAHMPEVYGTHHSKMMILLRADGFAQVVIHTANMIPQDWANLTQAVWRSPLLPLLSEEDQAQREWRGEHAIGTGLRFKADLLKYLGTYERRTRTLVDELMKYDFSAIRAALISSTPGKRAVENVLANETTAFGWPGLKQILSDIPMGSLPATTLSPVINIQISSIATLTEKWIQNFLEVLGVCKKPPSKTTSTARPHKPEFNIIFPTAEEIRQSLDGYASGHSIHMKLQSAAQQKQLLNLKPMLHHWQSNVNGPRSAADQDVGRNAHRHLAAPHIKTYIRFSDSSQMTIDWAIITSANLSQQAWGFMTDKNRQVRIASYEIGVVVWPGVFKDRGGVDSTAVMVPTFGKDVPDDEDMSEAHTVVGMRMPYDLPSVPYAKSDIPWCATTGHGEPDRHGSTWG